MKWTRNNLVVRLFFLTVCATVFSGCSYEKRDFYLPAGKKLVYDYKYTMKYSPFGLFSQEPSAVDGKFILTGGNEVPISENDKIDIKSQEVKLSFIPSRENIYAEKDLIPQAQAGVQLLPISGDMRVIWGMPPFDSQFLFFHFGEKRLKDMFTTRLPVDAPWLRPGAALENIPVRRYHPTEKDLETYPYFKKFEDGVVYEYFQDVPFDPQHHIPFHIYGKLGFKVLESDVKIQGEIIVNPKTRRILRRKETQFFTYVIEGINLRTGGMNTIRIDRGEDRTLELVDGK